jgi:aminopeptidase N
MNIFDSPALFVLALFWGWALMRHYRPMGTLLLSEESAVFNTPTSGPLPLLNITLPAASQAPINHVMTNLHDSPAPPTLIRREDYRAPDFQIPNMDMTFRLEPHDTRVTARLSVVRSADHDRPLVLMGQDIQLVSIARDGAPLGADDYEVTADGLTLHHAPARFTLDIETQIDPANNTQLMGLYVSGGNFCTQCEAEGFRRICFFPDRPDVLSRYHVRIEADKALYPVLLSNGNLTASGDLEEWRHFAQWDDPFPKPSYLFALVAGTLSANHDTFTTQSGRVVDLNIWVAEKDLPKTAHAMHALKASMAWDERVYGREYDLDQFNIVAVDDFNFGAMENKGLNIFNARYVLADAETATDADFDAIAGIVAHEYFHNWSGNRVTCRDWFQLSLKEGFTVFRDQSFSADQGSAAVQRIEDVRVLRAHQFPEDSGPLAHPIRPDSYMEISNFYTTTIYDKGAEVIRMMHTLAGADRFRKGTDLYFDRHDGTAATCDDFVEAMEDGAGLDLTQFRQWYSQAGTPKVSVQLNHDTHARTATLHIAQSVDDGKAPMAIPLAYAVFDQETGKKTHADLHLLDTLEKTLMLPFTGTRPIVSLNRNFAAPIIVESNISPDDLAFLARYEEDAFARFEALQQLMLHQLVSMMATGEQAFDGVVMAVAAILDDPHVDASFKAEAVQLPSEAYLGDQMLVVDPETIHTARAVLKAVLGSELSMYWQAIRDQKVEPYTYTPAAKGERKLRNIALDYMDSAEAAFAQFSACDNMTDRMAALKCLANGESDARVAALDIFYNLYSKAPLVLDKWFAVQATATRADTPEGVEELSRHPDFTMTNPNRVRALFQNFAANQRAFHRLDGKGYAILAKAIKDLDPINPQTAARLVPPLGRWRRFDADRQAMMKAALTQVLDTPGLSKDVFEQSSKSLAG